LKINKKEVLRYLGHKGQEISQEIETIINDAINEIEEIKFRFIFNIYPVELVGTEASEQPEIQVCGTSLRLKGKDICKHLEKAEKVALMAVTLGNEIEDKIRKLNYTDMTKAVIYDACASAMVESCCDYVEQNIKELADNEEYFITSRYSPGYGDLGLETQKDFIEVLGAAKKIGLHVSETNILTPRKSVTAIIGFQKEEAKKEKIKCKNCPMNGQCVYS